MRRFHLLRDVDVTGVSGTGVVAEGIEFSDGTVVVRWLSTTAADRGEPQTVADLIGASALIRPTTVVHPNVGNVLALHGHGGATRIEWMDQPA